VTVHLESSLHIAHCCVHHGCKYHDEQCPVYFGHLSQEGPCSECALKASGPFTVVDPFKENDVYDRKTPVPNPSAKLTSEQMMDLLIDILDTKEVQERLAEVVTEVLRERLLSHAEEQRRGSYAVLSPDVTDDLGEE
jgi:hypothetical protein